MAVLMDCCLYCPDGNGRDLVAHYLEKSPLADSDKMTALREMTRACYSIFQITDVEKGVGIAVEDLLRNESHFIADIGFGSSASRYMMLASRVIPTDGFLVTGGVGRHFRSIPSRADESSTN